MMKYYLKFLGLLFFSFFFKHGICSQVNEECSCGEANIKEHGRIVNGVKTTPHKYPWMSALFSAKQHNICGGSIISNKNILTAGHCLFYIKDQLSTFWVLGMHTVSPTGGESYRTSEYSFHPQFINNSLYDDYDMSIVTVDRPILFSDNIKPICLPSFLDHFESEKVIVAGWGKLGEGRNSPSAKVLMETKVMLKTDDECRIMTESVFEFNSDSMICAHEVRTDACQGDSGGPLFIETDPNRFEILGIVSFGDGCATAFPGIYSKVTNKASIDWIYDTIEKSQAVVCTDSRSTPGRRFE